MGYIYDWCSFQDKDKNVTHAFTQTDSDHINFENNATSNCEEVDNEPKNVAEDIKEAAELAMKHMGFVYEETSGMYYDYNTGYYYNAVSMVELCFFRSIYFYIDQKIITIRNSNLKKQ